MITLTQLIYVQPGQQDVFHTFESLAIPIISKYDGELLLRLRPNTDTVIESSIATPYELHLVSFKSEADFQAFLKDEERERFLHLKERSIKVSILIKGEQMR